MIGTISFPKGKLTISYECESNDQFSAKQEQLKFEKENKLDKSNRENICLLEIISFTVKQAQGNGRYPLSVTYNCDQTAKSLQKILEQQQGLKEEEKILYFCQLIELAQILKKQQIIHQNMKPSNVIWYNNKFYLINFGQLNNNPSLYVIRQNYVDGIKDDNYKRYVYPYLTYQFLSEIKEHLGNLTEMEKIIKNRKKEDLQKDDRYALGVMMLELFIPLENIYQNFKIEACIDQAQKMKVQLERIYECYQNDGEETIDKVYKIIHDITAKVEIPKDELPEKNKELKLNLVQHKKQTNNLTIRTEDNNNQSMASNNSIIMESPFKQSQNNDISPLIPKKTLQQKTLQQKTLQQKMTNSYQPYISSLINNYIYKFDPNLLYYLDKETLQNYISRVNNNPQFKLMIEKAKNIIKLINADYLAKKQYIEFSLLRNEDKYYLLQNYVNENQEINDEIEQQIKEINKIEQNQFEFNQIIIPENFDEIQVIDFNQEIQINESNQDLQFTQKSYQQMLQQKIPQILLFMKYQRLLKNENDCEFEKQEYIKNQRYSAKVSNKDQYWHICESKPNQLYIGNKIQNLEFEGRVIEQSNNGQIVDYENVIVNLTDNKKSGDKVTVTIYDLQKFNLISTYVGNLKDNLYDGIGKIIDWSNNYNYDGEWVEGRQHGQGTFKILNTELERKYEFIELVGTFENGYIKEGTKIVFPPYYLPPNTSNIGKGTFYFEETLRFYKYREQEDQPSKQQSYEIPFVKIDSSKMCKVIQNRLCNFVNCFKKKN